MGGNKDDGKPKSTQQSQQGQQGQQSARGTTTSSRTPAPAVKRLCADTSLNNSLEEITQLSQNVEQLSTDVKTVRDDLKKIMNKEEMETFITASMSRTISELNETIEHMIALKVDAKLKDLTDRLETVESENKSLKTDIGRLKNELNNVKKQNENTTKTSNAALAKANYNEQYSRKNNLKIMNINEKLNETEEVLTKEVCDLLKGKGVTLDPAKIMAIHRIPGKEGQPKPVLIKLMNNNEKSKIMRKRSDFKSAGNRLVDDVTKLNAELIKRLLGHRSIEQAWYFNGSVYGKSTDGKRYKFDINDEIDEVLRS